MKLPQVRLTVRRMMVLVATLALLLGAARWVVVMRQRSAEFQRRVSEFEISMMRIGSVTHLTDGRLIDLYEDENDRRHDAWTLSLIAKYRRLSYYPWLTVEPDAAPPVPLAHPKGPFELPPKMARDVDLDEPGDYWPPRPPAWTFLWTWPRQY